MSSTRKRKKVKTAPYQRVNFPLAHFGISDGAEDGLTATTLHTGGRSRDGRRISSQVIAGPRISPIKQTNRSSGTDDFGTSNFTYDFLRQFTASSTSNGFPKTVRVKKVMLSRKKRYASSASNIVANCSLKNSFVASRTFQCKCGRRNETRYLTK